MAQTDPPRLRSTDFDAVDPPVATDPPKRYDAFISYSHAADNRFAPQLQVGLQQLAKRWNRRRALEVFRDQTGLSVSPALWPSICDAMDGAEWFVLLASPKAAKSDWVGREIRRWLATKGSARILPVLTDGQWAWDATANDFERDVSGSAVHPALYGAFRSEPFFLDMTWANTETQLTLHNGRFRDHVATLAAPIHKLPKDELEGADIQEQRRTQHLKQAAISGLAILLVLAIAGGLVAYQQYRNAAAQRDKAVFNQTVTQGDLARGVDPSLAAQLDLSAYRMRETPDLYTRLLSAGNSALSIPLTGHTGRVNSVKVSVDGHTMATASGDTTVRLWDLSDSLHPMSLGPPLGHDAEVYTVAFGNNGVLASGADDGRFSLWNVADPVHPVLLSRTLVGSGSVLNSVDVSPDGKILAVADLSNPFVTLWNIADPAHPLRLDNRLSEGSTQFVQVAFSPNGRTLAGGGTNAVLRLWDVSDTSRPVPVGPVLTGHQSTVTALAFGPDGRYLASGSQDSSVRLWNVADPANSGPVGEPLTAHSSVIAGVSFSRDGQRLATTAKDQSTLLWNVADLAHPIPIGAPLLAGARGILSVAFGAGDAIATGGEDGTVRVWHEPATILPTNSVVLSGAFRPDGRLLATGGQDATITLWGTSDPTHPALLTTLPGLIPASVDSVAFSSDGHTLAASVGRVVVLWNVTDLKNPFIPKNAVLEGHSDSTISAFASIPKIAFTHGGGVLASVGFDGTVRLWDVSDLSKPVQLSVASLNNPVPMLSLAFSPNDRTLAVGSLTGVSLWNVTEPRQPQMLNELAGPLGVASTVAYSPDGHTLAAGSDDVVRLWNVTDPSRAQPLSAALAGHTSTVSGLAFTDDGRTLASTSRDSTVRLWDMTTPALARPRGQPLGNHTGPIGWVAATPAGAVLATGGVDRTTRMWPMNVDISMRSICATTSGTMTPDRWKQYVADVPYNPPCPSH